MTLICLEDNKTQKIRGGKFSKSGTFADFVYSTPLDIVNKLQCAEPFTISEVDCTYGSSIIVFKFRWR